MMKSIWKLTKHVVIFFGVLLSFIALMEIVRCYQTFYDLHPWAGYGFVLLLAVGLIWLAAYYWKIVASRPKVLTPPKIDDFANASARKLKKYMRYLVKYCNRLAINPNLDDARQQQAAGAAMELSKQIDAGGGKARSIEAIRKTEDEVIRPLLKVIDDKASKHIRNSMRDIMIAVTLSPYKSVDLMVVVVRNVRMVTDLIRMYNARPGLKEQLRIFYDILTIVATVNYIHMGRSLLESLGTRIPGIGRFLDDIAQGIGAGFMTTVTGHAAMQRCRAFDGWDPQKARENILSHLGDFYADVRDIFFKDVWGSVIDVSGQTLSSAKGAVNSAIDETGKQIAKWVRVPVIFAADAGTFIAKPFRKKE